MIHNLIFIILFLKILFRVYKFFILLQSFLGIIRAFFILDFLAESLKANKN